MEHGKPYVANSLRGAVSILRLIISPESYQVYIHVRMNDIYVSRGICNLSTSEHELRHKAPTADMEHLVVPQTGSAAIDTSNLTYLCFRQEKVSHQSQQLRSHNQKK